MEEADGRGVACIAKFKRRTEWEGCQAGAGAGASPAEEEDGVDADKGRTVFPTRARQAQPAYCKQGSGPITTKEKKIVHGFFKKKIKVGLLVSQL